MTVTFTYSRTVTTPPSLVGSKGDTRKLNLADAQRLQAGGWGEIKPVEIEKPQPKTKDKR